ncbi:MAG: putative deoxyribonuclease RhsA [Candidatus Hydrogenedentes bacterium ADurb.Bin101]|nr:MAG: putative deoxyribonuclease RhsA [Candidatus Hydrogenedentes bacterium ADurb.Bin101]
MSEPDVYTGVDTATLETIRGGQSDGFYIGMTEAYMQCINQDRPEGCPPERPPNYGGPSTGGGGGNNPTSAPHSKGTSSPGDIHNGPYVNTPGAMADPANPSVNPNIPFGGSALTVSMGTNHRAMSMMQTDIHVPTRGAMDFFFRRVYYNPWGKHRDYMASETRPYKNNIGNGWRHNFNVHVRLSSANGYLAYVDANGNFKRFTRTDTNVNGYDLYQRAPLDMDEEDVNALRTERAIRARRHVQEGWVEIEFPDGITCRFSAPINDLERYCRLESFEDVSGNTFTLAYADLWLTGADSISTNFGRLSQVTAPSGDDRYLQFYYSGNLIERVDLLQPDGAGTEILKKVEYSYGPYKTGQGTPYNYLRSVEIDDNPDDTVYFEYEEGVYDNTVVGMYPSKITDKEGNQLEIACTYGYVPGNNFISTTETALTFPDGLTTVYEKTYKDYTDVRNYDGAAALSRFFFKVDGHGVRVDYARYYHEPGGATYDQWNYYYENNYDLTAVGNVAVQYWYNDDGRVTKYACGYVYYRYEYPAGGGLYPIRQYGPGTADDLYKGPMTEFVYDAYDRLVQVKPPDMGSNGLSIAYDAYGQVTSRTNASSDTQSYTYDSRGNMTSHTDYESNTWTCTYDDLGRMVTQTDPANRTTTYTYTGGCPSCGGASGQIASITLPDNRQLFFDYDNNGNLILQTDPLGHETAYSYDGMGRLVSVLTEEGRQQTFTYDILGNMISKTDFGGKTTHYEYDYRGLMTRTWLQVGAVEDTLVENEYNISGWLVKVTDGEGQDINFAYNERGQVTRTSHGEWCSLLDTCDFGALHIWNDYDQYGRLYRTRAETRTPAVNIVVDPIEYFYNDTTGQLTRKRTTNDNGAVVNDVDYYYDVNGKLTRVDDWTGGSGNDGHEFAYDDNGKVTTYTDYDDAELSYTYDALGRPVAMDAYETGNSYGYAYNTAGQLSTITAPGNRQWGFNYDNAGQLSYYTWPNGQRTEYTYDDDGRLTGLVHKDSPASGARAGWQYVLGDDGTILRMVDARSAYQADREYEYDHRDRLIRALWYQSDGAPQLRLAYTYDAADNMLSQTRYSYTSRVYDAFMDGDFTGSPAWTVESGTWSAATGALVPVPQSGARAISTANTYGNADVWYAFKRTGTGGGLDNSMVQLRYVDANNWLGVRFMWNMLIVVEKANGVEQDLAYTGIVFAAQDVWYEIYIQLDGSSVILFACERGDTLRRLLETTTNLGVTTNALRVRVSGVMPFEFDEFRVCSRSIHAGQSMTFTYGPANQLATMTMSGVTSSYTYDPWGRLASRSATISGQSYTATYTYRFGDKLKRIDSNFPTETAVVQYNYDGLGKRRLKAIGNDTTYWRWDTGTSVLAQYQDTTPDWGISGFDRFFVPFGHTALAEADLDASGVPANAAYTYLTHDHLGTSTHGFDQSKTVVSQNVHLPFGQRSYAYGNSPYHEFTGKPWDAESQMYYFPYRYYSPSMNRWTSADPAGLVDGPNVYGYVGGNPMSSHDPLGLTSNIFPTSGTGEGTNCRVEVCRTRLFGIAKIELLWIYHEEARWPKWGEKGHASPPNYQIHDCNCQPAIRSKTGTLNDGVGKGKHCASATCEDIASCLFSARTSCWSGSWGRRNNCQTSTTRGLEACCMRQP